LRYKGNALFNAFLQSGYKIYFLNYAYNSQDMRNSASIYNSASRYISTLNSNTQMIAAGISMGGVVVRYALAKAENDGNPLPFNKFISIDAPQSGAVFDIPFQTFMSDKLDPFQKHGLNNDAAKELLNFNIFGDLHSSFYSELNSLNGGKGYPSLTENTGVSFSNGTPNPGNGRWIVVTFYPIIFPGSLIYETSDLYDGIKVPGSYLPRSTGVASLSPAFMGMTTVDRDPINNPTFIPYSSSLNIVNGTSRFNVTIQANANYFHDQFPTEVIAALIKKLLPLSVTISGPSSLKYLQNGTWNASTIGGCAPFNYQWYYEYSGSNSLVSSVIKPNLPPINTWYTIGSNSPTLTNSFSYYPNGIYLKCVVTDLFNTVVTSNIFTVYVGNGNSSIASNLTTNNSLSKNVTENSIFNESIDKFMLNQNSPNPFNPTTIIYYQIPIDGYVSLKVYDVLGREIKTLVNEIKNRGKYSISFDASNLASGIYLYQLRSNDFISSKKMIVTK
jgi:Secretion system C-terminal sorting domain